MRRAAMWALWCAAASTGLMAGCRLGMSGPVRTETRKVGAFEAVELDGAGSIELTVGKPPSLEVSAVEQALPQVHTNVRGGVLHIDTTPLHGRGKVHVRASTPSLHRIEVSGAAKVKAVGISGGRLETVIEGAGSIELHGNVDRTEVTVKGAGSVHAEDLVAKEAAVSIQGAGDVRVHATETLDANIAGAGRIRYAGHPKQVHPDIAGAGVVKPLN